MKFYNPFRWHIVEFNDGRFGVRKLTLDSGFGFCDKDGIEWFYLDSKSFIKWCMFTDTETVKNILSVKLQSRVKRVVQ